MDNELQQLIEEQRLDDLSNKILPDNANSHIEGLVVSMNLRDLVDIADKGKHEDTPVSWGMPAKICQAKMDKECPSCGRQRSGGFQIGDDGGWCPTRTNSDKYQLIQGKRELPWGQRLAFDMTKSDFAF